MVAQKNTTVVKQYGGVKHLVFLRKIHGGDLCRSRISTAIVN